MPNRGAPTLAASSMLNDPKPNPPERAIDGDPNIAWKTDKLSAWIVVDYGKQVNVHALEVQGRFDAAAQCTLDTWLDVEGKWREQVNLPASGALLRLDLPETVSTSRLRLRFTAAEAAEATPLAVGEINVDMR